MKDDPLSKIWSMLSVGLGLAVEKQKPRLEDLFKNPGARAGTAGLERVSADGRCLPSAETQGWEVDAVIADQ